MKLALVMVPEDANCDLVVNETTQRSAEDLAAEPPRKPSLVMFSKFKLTLILLALLVCTVTLVGGTFWYSRSLPHPFPPARHFAALMAPQSIPAPERSKSGAVVRPWDESQPLKVGDLVVARSPRSGAAQVQTVAGMPYETVVLRHGNGLKSLFMLGSNRYCVFTPEGEGHVVRADEISGTLVSSTTTN